MPQGVVHRFELVQVEVEQGEAGGVALGANDRLRHAIVEQQAVGQAGQVVVVRQVLDALRRLPLFGDVGGDGVAAEEPAVARHMRHEFDFDIAEFTVGQFAQSFISGRLSAQHLVEMFFDIEKGLFADYFAHMLAGQAFDRLAEELGEAPIGKTAAKVLVPGNGHRRYMIGEQAHLFCAVAQGLFRQLLLGNIDRHGIAARDAALFSRARHQLDLYASLLAALQLHQALIGDCMTLQRFFEMSFNVQIGGSTDDVAQGLAHDVVQRKAEKIRVALVGKNAIHAPVHIQDHARHVVDQQAHFCFAVAQRFFRLFALGDVGIDGDETAAWQRRSAHLQDNPVRARALEHMRLHGARALEPGSDDFLGVAGSIIAAQRIEAQQYRQRGQAVGEEFVGEVQQFFELRVARDHFQIRSKQRHAAGQIIQKHLQHRLRVVRDCALVRATARARFATAVGRAGHGSSPYKVELRMIA